MAKGEKGTRFQDYLSQKLQNPEFRREYEALGPRFDLAAALIRLRLDAGLTQEQLAERIGDQTGVHHASGGQTREPDAENAGEDCGRDRR